MTFAPEDAQAILSTANRLGVDPRTLGALMELESNVNPNVWGGAGGQYRGLIQFGPGARKEVGLPDGPMTIAQQMPYVEKYMLQRGFQPGKHGPTELYRTVLVGNPSQSGTDSFGTNSDRAAARMTPGGDLYQRFSKRFDPIISSTSSAKPATLAAPTTAPVATADNPVANMLAGFADSQLQLADQSARQARQLQERQQMNQLLRSVVSAGKGGGGALAGFLAGMQSQRMAGDGLGLDRSGVETMANATSIPASAFSALMRAAQPSSTPAPAPVTATVATGSGSTGVAAANAIQPTTGNLAPVYTTSGIGPTSTGPHLDIKPLNRQRFDPKALDDYIRVDGKNLTSFPITDTWDGHIARGSYGIDFGTPDGGKVTLHNGAEVVAMNPTEHGDKLIIRTPRGDFSFLHGRAFRGG